jgi:hypothetical protein
VTGSCHQARLVLAEMEVSWAFGPGWWRTSIFLISTSQLTRITGVSHHTWQRVHLLHGFERQSEFSLLDLFIYYLFWRQGLTL